MFDGPIHRGKRHHETLGDPKITTMFLDRITHHCGVVATGIDSWRFKNRS
jgi:DNA replication protein DnaC